MGVLLISLNLMQKLQKKGNKQKITQKLTDDEKKNLPFKITISGTEGLKFDGHYSTNKNSNGERGDSVHIEGVIPAEYYMKYANLIYCAAAKQGEGTIRITISEKELGDIVADSSNSDIGLVYASTAEIYGYRLIGPGIKHYPAAYFLKVESADTISHSVILFKDWDEGVHLSSSISAKCPFTVKFPDCDVVAATFIATTDMEDIHVTLSDANNNILKKDSSINKMPLYFEHRIKHEKEKGE